MPALKKIGAAALAAFGWTSGGASAVTASYLVVAGGGSGTSGGGGGGGLLTGTTSLNPTLSYTVVIGAGGTGAIPGTGAQGSSGSNSSVTGLTAAVGGGAGGKDTVNGFSGGSGGGGGVSSGTTTGGAATSGQGNAGGGNAGFTAAPYASGGGGGAGAAGANASSASVAGNGGNGIASSISGSSVTYAGGGGGGIYSAGGTAGTGGTGGGGNGAVNTATPQNGTANLGGGGGGTGNPALGGNGGSGIVIISYAGAQQFGGGIVTSVGGNTIHTFLTSGTLSPLSSLSASYLIVAGGGGGGAGYAGGGGAGGLLANSGLTIDTNSTYLVTVGSGGAGGAVGFNNGVSGTNSSFSLITAAIGGGAGAGWTGTASSGGSGGGGVASGGSVGSGTTGQGNSGGSGSNTGINFQANGGGGGGAGSVGGNGTAGGNAGAGGSGYTSSISGVSSSYAGGGGGGAGIVGSGGTATAGGGAGGANAAAGTSGTANTGGGGGGSGANSGTGPSSGNGTGGNGGSGIVIISYPGSTQQMAGGSVTIVGGNVIHTFTSSGYLTPLTYYSNSLRFRSSASAYLSRTPTVAGNRKTWTWSGWVKRGTLGGSINQLIFSCGNGTADTTWNTFCFTTSDTLIFTGYNTTWRVTSQVFRDPAAWYHIVLAFDTTQATAADRVKMYVNGVQITSFSTNNAPTQNTDYAINQAFQHIIGGSLTVNYSYLDGYQTNINFIDGQALTPNSFGTFNSYGVWQPITYGGSYGTNGFYLPFNSGSESYAAQFNGSSQYLSTTATGFNASTGSWTIEGWAYCTSSGNSDALLVGQVSGTDRFYLAYGGTTLYLGDVATNNVVATNAKPLNQWFHWAAVKNGSTYTVYINGIAVGSSTTALGNYSLTTWLIGARPSAPNYLLGYMSNVRINTTTAVYTSNFVPSTTPLTAISGTQLLTLQNATFVDNSTNNYTITNNGSMANPATGKPLSTAVFQDQSPQGNNWTPVNISGATGSTLDYMTDVPTLTSATAANYAVWNPLNNFNNGGTVTFSNANLTVDVGQYGWVLPTMPIGTDKWYCELTVTSITQLSAVGLMDPSQNYIVNYFSDARVTVDNGSPTSYGSTWTTGDVIGMAADGAAKTIIFYKNGVSQGSVSWTGTYTFIGFAAVARGATAGTRTFAANFGQQPWKYTPPTNYIALNTYNL